MRKLISLLVLAAFLLGIASVAYANPYDAKRDPKRYGGTLIWGSFADPIYLNPAVYTDSASADVNMLIYNGLVTYNDKLELVGNLAESWSWSANGLELTFNLKKGVKFHDGVEFTSADVKFFIETMRNPKVASVRAKDYERVKTIETPDKYTVKFILSEKDAALITRFTLGVIPKHIWEKVDPAKIRESEYNRKPIGTGPFKFKEWTSAERVVVEANKDYFEGRPYLDSIIYKIVPSQSVLMVQLQTGEIDIAFIPASDVARMRKVRKINVRMVDGAVFDYIGWNFKDPNDLTKPHPILGDPKVRKALDMAINKKAIVSEVLKGIGTPATGSYVPALPWYNRNVKANQYNLVQAKKLLAEAGWKMGKGGVLEKGGKKFTVTMLTNKGNVNRERITVVIQRQLKPLGIKVEPRILEWNTFINKYLIPGKFDAVVGGYSTGFDPDQSIFWKTGGGFNRVFYSNPEMDKLLDQGRGETDLATRRGIYNRVQEILATDAPLTFLYYQKRPWGVSKKVTKYQLGDLLEVYDFADWAVK